MTRPSAAKQMEAAGRIPPHSLEMERALLCACLIDPNGAMKVMDKIAPDDFYDRRHSMIWDAIGLLYALQSSIDILTVAETLQRADQLELAGGEMYLVTLSGEISTSAHADHYADVVKDLSNLRKLIIRSSDLIQKAYERPMDIPGFLSDGATSMMELVSADYISDVRRLSDVMPSVMDQIDKNANHLPGAIIGLPTGFDDLDDLTGGLQEGELIIVAARPSMGKTSLAVDWMRKQAELGIPTLMFSMEMASRQIGMRVLAAEASVNLHRLRQGKLSDADWNRISNSINRINQFPIFIDDKSGIGIAEVITKATKYIKEKKIRAIYIDYLQLFAEKAKSRNAELGSITRALKVFSRDNGIRTVLLSQLSRAVETRGGDKIPQLSDLRDSGAIEQDADVVMFIHRKKQYKHGEAAEACDRIADIIVRKQRNGPTGTVRLVFNEIYSRFDNLDIQASKGINMNVEPVHHQYENDTTDEEVPF